MINKQLHSFVSNSAQKHLKAPTNSKQRKSSSGAWLIISRDKGWDDTLVQSGSVVDRLFVVGFQERWRVTMSEWVSSLLFVLSKSVSDEREQQWSWMRECFGLDQSGPKFNHGANWVRLAEQLSRLCDLFYLLALFARLAKSKKSTFKSLLHREA